MDFARAPALLVDPRQPLWSALERCAVEYVWLAGAEAVALELHSLSKAYENLLAALEAYRVQLEAIQRMLESGEAEALHRYLECSNRIVGVLKGI